MMVDLKHWDFADSFTAKEMAMLIIGLDPAIETHEAKKIKPVMDRIHRGVDDLWWYLGMPLEDSDFLDIKSMKSELFPSVILAHYKAKNWKRVREWVDNYSYDEALSGIFNRDEIARWLTEMKFDSVYDFKKTDCKNETKPTVEADNPERTNLLKMIGLLALVLAEKSPKFKTRGKPNYMQIADAAEEALALLPDTKKYGLTASNIRKKLSEAWEELQKP